VAGKNEPIMQPSPKRCKREGAAAASMSELSDEAPKSTEDSTGNGQLFAGSGSEDLPPGVGYNASSGLYMCDGSAPTQEMIRAWHDESPKPSPEEMISMGRQSEANRKETIRRVAEIKKVCVLFPSFWFYSIMLLKFLCIFFFFCRTCMEARVMTTRMTMTTSFSSISGK